MSAVPRETLEVRLDDLQRRWQRAEDATTAAQAEVDALRADKADDLEALLRATARLQKAQQRKRALAQQLETIEDQL